MPLNPARIGTVEPERTVTWTERDALLYALGVGAGQDDRLDELELTTENSEGIGQQVVPSFAVVLGMADGLPEVGEFDPTRAVHAEQHFEVDGPLPPCGSATVTTTVADMWDKGRDAMLWTETVLTDAVTGARLARSRSAAYLGGAGGFGGHRGGGGTWERPDATPDFEVRFATRPEQALLYRLTGDRNPLHSDPVFAARGGFDVPILHGMCTYGYATRLLVRHVADGDTSRLAGMSGRFTRPVLPGDVLFLRVWKTPGTALFQVVSADGSLVIDRGTASFRARPDGVGAAGPGETVA
jgi:acyl dehydratase